MTLKSAAEIAREQEEGLALLFQRGLELALKVQEDAMAAEAPEDRARLSITFHRLSRGVRQTAALRQAGHRTPAAPKPPARPRWCASTRSG